VLTKIVSLPRPMTRRNIRHKPGVMFHSPVIVAFSHCSGSEA
jgi:hypothetical protein